MKRDSRREVVRRGQRDGGGAVRRRDVAYLVASRAPFGFLFFIACLLLSTLFEVVRFPQRRGWMLSFAGGFIILTGLAQLLIRRRPVWTVPVLLTFINVVGVGLNAYHVIVGASFASCLWTLTGLLACAAVFLPWGPANQTLASFGALLSYPLHLHAGRVEPLAWGAGGTYLVIVAGMSVFGAALYARYLREDVRLKRALSEREARLQSYFDLALVGTAILATDGTCSEVNDELCRLLGYSRNELLGRRWSDLTEAEERAAGPALLEDAFAGRSAPRPRDTRLVRRDGTVMPAAVGMRGLPGPADVIDHVMVVVQDITERKRADAQREELLARELEARRQAEAASRAKDSFLAAVSHELRTPLSPILAWCELLRRGPMDPEQAERAIAAIARNAGAQSQLIEDLLDVSRIVSGNIRLELGPIDLVPVIREAVEVVRPNGRAKNVALEVALGDDPCHVSGDGDRLRQVFWNLLTNAVKFTSTGGTVRIALERDPAFARITVADTGQGISPEFLPHVFEPFRQGDPTPTRRHGGLGIGLAIVRELVGLHGGSVRADSTGEGAGAVFTVQLPRLPPGLALATRPVEAKPHVPLDGLRVLVVDDDPDSNEAVRALLASVGAEVRTAGSARQALEVLAQWLPDLLVSDIAMPGEDGYALLARLRAEDSPHRGVPAVALTAYAGPEDREQMLSAGFQAHVPKPVRTAELMSAVEAAARASGRL
jgi:PAS domain S-box-containing protein